MMQMPLSSYPHFSQFLQLQQLHQQRYSRSFLSSSSSSSPQTADLGMLSAQHRSGTSCSEASTGTPSSSPSPPLSITENFSTNNGHHQNSTKSAKSFTIDAILGIRDREIEKINRDHINVLPNNFHPRLGLHLSNSHLDLTNNYSSTLDLTNATLEIGTRIDVARFSTSSRDILGFQLPADLSTSSEVSNFAGEIGRRNLQNQISTFQNSNSCSSLTEKSTSDVSKKCGGKSKRVRTIFTPEQLERLEAEFERQQYMVGPERLYLAHTLQLTEAQVKVWFQNRRIKWRKQHLEIQQQRLAAIKQQSQRGDIEESDDESGDSNNFSFSTDTNDNGATTFFKSVDNNLDNNLGQYRDKISGSFQDENKSENLKNDSNGEKV